MTVSGYLQLKMIETLNVNFLPSPSWYLQTTGKVRLQSLIRPTVIKISAPSTTATPKHKTEKTPAPLMPSMTTGEDILCLVL